ncbi:MAG: hypothetical protein Q7S00_03205, partial [bacterium]|nr:hypothetical protein [bacterium]
MKKIFFFLAGFCFTVFLSPHLMAQQAYCGNNVVEPNVWDEECDGTNLQGFTCTDLASSEGVAYSGGTLSCYGVDEVTPCHFNTSGCTLPERSPQNSGETGAEAPANRPNLQQKIPDSSLPTRPSNPERTPHNLGE